MEYKGTLRKLKSAMGSDIQYWLNLNNEPVLALNPLVGGHLELVWTGQINCIDCGRSIKKTYGQGFCFQCYSDSPQAAPCIMRPELCEAHLGKGRDAQWELDHHNQPHIVYLAQTSGIKVGVTRKTQVPTRWIDQGAWRTVAIAEVPYRQFAGLLEVELKQYISDRTDWRKMLTDERDADDLTTLRDKLISFLPSSLAAYSLPNEKVNEFSYPVPTYPERITAVKLEDDKILSGNLTGIRGQYLYFDGNRVINLRKYSGFEIVATHA